MQKIFNETFQGKLYEAVQSIEAESDAEIVTLVYAHSSPYKAISLQYAGIIAWLSFTILMVIPHFLTDATLYFVPLLTFMASFVAIEKIPKLKAALLPQKLKHRNTEIYARALFQKAGIYHTQRKTGLLIFISLLEKKAHLIADRGIENALSLEDWQKIQNYFDAIFEKEDFESGLLEAIAQSKTHFIQNLPILPNDINELPDYIEVTL
ncbi:MAG: TPM domain-containing protein [Cetobacterium sp.]